MARETVFSTVKQPCCNEDSMTACYPQGRGLQDIVVAVVFGERSGVDDPRKFSQTHRPISLSFAMEQQALPHKKTSLIHSVRLPIKITVPSLSTPSTDITSPSRASSFSLANLHKSSDALREPPLLDDDPFANLASYAIPHLSNSSPSTSEHPNISYVPPPSTVVVSPQVHVPQPTTARPRSSGHGQIRPACTKPAFTPRPSLPSLHTLARMNVSVPGRKVRKGTPGARLPHEPWNMDLSAEFSLLTRNMPFSAGPSRPPDNQIPTSQPPLQETTVQTEKFPLQTTTNPETCFVSREFAINSLPLADETCSSRSLAGDNADVDSLPSLSDTNSEPFSSTLSRSSSIASSAWLGGSMDVNDSMSSHDQASMSLSVGDGTTEEDDPLSYHSDFDYYTQSLSDLSDSEPDVDPTKATRHSPLDVGITPYTSLCDPVVEPRSSADTMRRVSVPRKPTQTDTHVIGSPNLESPQDGGEWRGERGELERQSGREDKGRGREASRRNGGYSGGQSSGAYGGGAGGDDNNGDKARRGKPRSPDSSTSDFTSSSDDDADSITVYYSLDGMSNGPPSPPRTRSRYSKAGGGSDDDVPLAQRVPTALTAQKSIRMQLRDERRQRKLERAKSSRTAAGPPLPTRPPESFRAPAAPTSSRKRSMSAAPAPNSGSRAVPAEVFPAEDLTRKLANLQISSRSPPLMAPLTYDGSIPTNSSPRAPGYSGGVSRSSSRGRYTDQTTYLQQKTPRVPEGSSQDRPLRSMRSFHRSDGRYPETQRLPIDQTSAPRLGRSTTATASSRTVRVGRDAVPAGYEQHTKSGRVSEDGRKPPASVPRPSMDRESDVAQRAVQRPPVPPLPISDSTPPQHASRVPVVQQRIFIGDMQRFNMVEITPATNAGDVIDTVASQGMLDRSGSWMLFEMAQDYGMERPIRDYELLADVSASWNKDKLLNTFVIKQTPLAQLLSRPVSQSSNKHEIHLPSQCRLYLLVPPHIEAGLNGRANEENGANVGWNFANTAYGYRNGTRRHKSPKASVFAIKSTDHLSLFENAADYLHVFSCNPKDGEKWMQVILVARVSNLDVIQLGRDAYLSQSYVLYQERHVLFARTGESLLQAKPLSRSGTRKHSVSSRPAQPLVNVPPPFSQSPTANVAFEPGSLLAKRKGDAQL
ncbi:hypothetical protein J3R82DRAFT_9714 [Butyriboletus roseoflavus]|nr:hypothetical protein J3R82DRAFT_9714 [Butyriboletus roseoflavus]